MVQRCNDEGLIKGEGFATDASYIKADASRQRMADGPVDWQPSPTQSRAVREYLDALDNDPSATRTQKKVSTTDPMAQWAGDKGPGQFYYSTNYLIDIEHNVIMDVEPTPAYRIAEVSSTRTMIDRVEEKLAIKPERLIADTSYGSAEMLDWVVEQKQIEPHIPVWDKSHGKPGMFGRAAFTWDNEADCYYCPANKLLRCRNRPFKNRVHPLSIAQVSMTVKPANLNPGAVRILATERSPVVSMNHLVTLPGIFARPRNIYNPGKTEKRLKCCSPILSE